MKLATPSFDNVIITANIHYDNDEKCIKAVVLNSSGEETEEVLTSTPERLLEIYDVNFVTYITSGITCTAILKRRANSVWTEESDTSVPQYFYQVISYNEKEAENEYKVLTARNFGYDQGYYAGVRDLGNTIKTFMTDEGIEQTAITEKITSEVNNAWLEFSTAHPEVVDEDEVDEDDT